MSSKCNLCDEVIGIVALSIKCHTCDGVYHCECLNITQQQFAGFTREQKSRWKCLPCSNITRRDRSNSASLNRSVYISTNCDDDAMNMSCDNVEQPTLSPNSSSGSTSTIIADGGDAQTASIGDLSAFSLVLNNTLKGWRSDMDRTMATFTDDIRGSLRSWREEIENSISKFNDGIKSTLSEIKQDMSNLRSEQEELKERVRAVARNVSDLTSSVQFQADEHKDLKDRVNTIARSSSDQSQILINNLEQKLDSLEQQARNCNVEICNVPEKRGENLLQLIDTIGNAINFPTSQRDIISIHRVQHAQQTNNTNNRPKNIIVKFTTRIIRDNLLSAFRLAKGLKTDQIGISGSPTKIYINEHLTLKTKQLFRKSKDAAKQHDFKYVWVKNSTILVRERDGIPSFAVRTVDDIRKISSANKSPPLIAQNNSVQ